MLPLAGLHAASLGALVALGLAGAPTGVLVACGLAAGITIPPVGLGRPAAAGGPARRDDAGLLPTAYALDGIAIELVFVTGPLLTAAIVVVASPAVALLVACGFVILGTIVLVTSPASRAWRPDAGDHERHLLGALASPGVRTIVAATAPAGFAARRHRGDDDRLRRRSRLARGGGRAAGRVGGWAAASAAWPTAGASTRRRRARAGCAWPPSSRCARCRCCSPRRSPAMAPLALIAGLCLAPYMAAANQLVGDVAPPGAVTEAFAWPITAIGLGAAGGSAVGGRDRAVVGLAPGFVAVVAAGAVTALIAVAGRATVRA